MRGTAAVLVVSIAVMRQPAAAQSIDAIKPTAEVTLHPPYTALGFENTSARAVEFHWRLFLDGTSCASVMAERIEPKGRLYGRCSLDPRPGWLETGAFKPAKGEAILRVASTPVSEALESCRDCADHRVMATVGYYSRSTQTAWNVLALLLLLVLGGLFSHWITTTLPNVRRKGRLDARLQRLRWGIRWSAGDIDNDLASRLAVERSRLADQLASQPSWGNDTADVLAVVETELAALEQWSALLGRLVNQRSRLRRGAATLFRRQLIDRQVSMLLIKLANADIAEQLTTFDRELGKITAPGPGEKDAEFEEWCVEQAANVGAIIEMLRSGPLRAALPVLAAGGLGLTSPLEPRGYAVRELVLLKLQLLQRLHSASAGRQDAGELAARLKELDALEDASELRPLRAFVVGLESDRALADIRPSLTDADIEIRPRVPRAFEPVILEFQPADPVARRLLQAFELEGVLDLRWTVFEGTRGTSAAWRRKFVAHGSFVKCYFASAGSYRVALEVNDTSPPIIVDVNVSRSRSRVTAQFGTEAARLVGAQLLAATAAFLSAWDALLQRDLAIAIVAALAAGYGADTLKTAGATILSRIKGTGKSIEAKKATFDLASAELEK